MDNRNLYYRNNYSHPSTRHEARPDEIPFKVDVLETPDAFILEADLPGCGKDNIHMTAANDTLTIEAARPSRQEETGFSHEYCRRFDITGLDPKDMKVTYTDGVLRIVMNKPVVKEPEVRTLTIG